MVREISTSPPLSVIKDHVILLTEDLPTMDANTTILYASDIEKYFVIGSGKHGRMIRLSNALAREARGVNGTVVTGTDGHLYLCLNHLMPDWREDAHPITGGFWTIYWERIQDDVCNSPVTAWGTGFSYPTYGSAPCATYHNGYLYVSLNQSISQQALRKIDPMTLERVASANRLGAGKIIGHGSLVYVAVGTVNAQVISYNASDLTSVATSGVLPYGRFVNGGDGDFSVVDGRLIVTTVTYTGQSALYALDLNTLEILDVVTYSAGAGGPIYQRLARIDDTTVVIAENDGVGIARLNGLRVPSGVGAGLEGADPPYLSFNQHSYEGYSQQWVLAQILSGASNTPASQRCGTSPVWPMPA